MTSFDRDLDEIPTKWEICPTCSGAGHCVHPHIDGITQDEWSREDADFAVQILTGAYDVVCPDCQGIRVQRVPDFESMTEEQIQEYNDDTYGDYADDLERRAERDAGC